MNKEKKKELQKSMYNNVLNKGVSIQKGTNISLCLPYWHLYILASPTLKKIFYAALPLRLQNS